MAHKSPGYSDATPDHAALDLIGYLGFSQNSPLYEQLVIQEQSVDMLWASNPDHVDPYLFTIVARVKDRVELPRIQAAILSTLEEFASKPVDPAKLEQVKSHLRYSFALSLNSSEPIAATLAHYLSLAPTPETINRVYAMHERLTPADLQNAARRYLTERGRTTVTLSHGDLS